jgi:lactate dehydrogenase-like 2-hydroxyacid dehydrogenase
MATPPKPKPRLLQNGKLPQPTLEARLAAEFDLHRLHDEADREAFLAAHGHEFDAIVTSAPVGADATLIDALPNLKLIAGFGVGFDKVDRDAALRRGVRVSYTPDVLNDCVADLAFALLLDVARGVSASDRFVRRGEWLQRRFPIMTKASGKRVGILGLGRIGQAVARRALGFDMEVGYCNREPLADVSYTYLRSPIELARWCDFLVVTVAGGPATHHLVDRQVLDALGPDGFLVNVARGTVVDEAALVQALVDRRIGGAGLDVFEEEPRVPAALCELDHVVLTPHVASGTAETRAAMADLVIDNLRGFFATGTLKTPVPWSPD